MPRPLTKAIFSWKRKKQTFILSPTYTAYDEKRILVENVVAEAVSKRSYRVATPRLPLKLIASRSELGKYGQNNIMYVEGMGSFMPLTAVYSDIPCEEDQLQKTQILTDCENCDRCKKAMSNRGHLLNTAFCLKLKDTSLITMKKASIPFPDWIKPGWHNYLTGCMICQAACPLNRPYLAFSW